MSDLTTLPDLTVTAAGPQPQAPADLRAQLVALAVAASPGLTANLPGSLIEDIASTDVGALAVIDSARVDLINSISPFSANPFVLGQLGQIYLGAKNGVQGSASNNSVFVTFTGSPGYVIVAGFTVSDGSHQYIVQDGGIIGSDGLTLPLFCLAVLSGSWAIPAGTVTQLVTSVPSAVTLSVTNPAAGLIGLGAEAEEAYRARILMAGMVGSIGTPAYLKTLLLTVPGVQPNLVSMRQQTGGGWEVICGGGDPYQVGYAIFTSLFDISTLVGSTIDAGRDLTVSINDYPDSYDVIFVNPVQQTVAITLTWNTSSTNIIANAAIAQLASQPLINYVNNLPVGVPMNLFELQAVFQTAIAGAIPPQLLTRMVFQVIINGSIVAPSAGTGIIAGDPEGYFFTSAPAITVNRG